MFGSSLKKYRIYIRFFFVVYIVFGILMVGVNGILTSYRIASPMNIALPLIESVPSTPPIDKESAQSAKNNSLLREHVKMWEIARQNPRQDIFGTALTAYQIASVSDEAYWSMLSIKFFDEVLEKNPDFALARAWRGSAHAIYAGDYPIQGWWQIIPGPGFVRLYHIRLAFNDLNAAVKAAPTDPVTRLIRASTYIGMPSIFGGTNTGIEDFELLERWISNPSENSSNADILESREWRAQYYLNRAKAMEKLQNSADAKEAWENLLKESDDIADKELAKWYLN